MLFSDCVLSEYHAYSMQTMQAYHAKVIQRLERQREEKAAEKMSLQRRLMARESAAKRELEQVQLSSNSKCKNIS